MPRPVHLVGIAGTGMSALAEALLDAGEAVTGSDRFLDAAEPLPSLAALRAQGVPLFPQDGSGVTPATARVVASVAIEDDNPDLAAIIDMFNGGANGQAADALNLAWKHIIPALK